MKSDKKRFVHNGNETLCDNTAGNKIDIYITYLVYMNHTKFALRSRPGSSPTSHSPARPPLPPRGGKKNNSKTGTAAAVRQRPVSADTLPY